jgi:hypothetical protein
LNMSANDSAGTSNSSLMRLFNALTVLEKAISQPKISSHS